jgi:hypothetical protein
MVVPVAATAATALVQAMVTDGWEGVRQKVVRLFGRGHADAAIERRLDATREQLSEDDSPELERLLVSQWETRFADLLADHPDAEPELTALARELRAARPVVASDHAVAAGRDVNVTAHGGGVAAALIAGNVPLPGVPPPGPPRPGPVSS